MKKLLLIGLLFGCTTNLVKRQKTQDEINLIKFQEQIKVKTHFTA